MTEEQKTLQDLVIQAITTEETRLNKTEEPEIIQDDTLNHVINQYFLTKENIKQITQIIFKHKEKEEWLDVYILEYKEGKLSENYERMRTKQGLLKEKPKKESEGTLRFLIKDDYAVFIRSYNKEIEREAEEAFKNLKKLGLNEYRFNPKTLQYEII